MRRRVIPLTVLAVGASACSATLNPFAGVRRAVALAHLGIVLIALVDIAISKRSKGAKLGWALIVIFFPIVGLAAYLIAGRRD
jgi:hypothetical protein